MPLETPARIATILAERGFNAERSAITLLVDAENPERAIQRAIETAPAGVTKITADHVDDILTNHQQSADSASSQTVTGPGEEPRDDSPSRDPPISTGTEGDSRVTITGDITGDSTGSGEYEDFLAVFRDRYERLSNQLRGRVTHRPTDALESMPGGSDGAIVGMVAEIDSTRGGHWRIELEDTNGTFPVLVLSDRDIADAVSELLTDEVIAVEGTISDDGEILFADAIHFPDVPRTNSPSTADREVRAALVSDLHVGSQEFDAGAWERFAEWLHEPAADTVEYLLVGGDAVEGVGVYPDQDEELTIVDIYDQYERFSELLKLVPGEIEVVIIPGNHDPVRLAEPQPAFREELRDILDATDPRIVGNPARVTIEGVSILMYHGVSLDEIIAELPDERANYDEPQKAMARLLRKRHLAPQFGGHTRIAPEERDYMVIEDVPDIFHTGHVHKLGYSSYHGVRTINSACWQHQTSFQESVNIDPDVGYAPIVRLDRLGASDPGEYLTIRSFTD
ncbi:MAG: DNA-directed DNA polymerase II small subunit [Halococcoides sp.]